MAADDDILTTVGKDNDRCMDCMLWSLVLDDMPNSSAVDKLDFCTTEHDAHVVRWRRLLSLSVFITVPNKSTTSHNRS